jgi:DNA-binding IscR family transcriptional regulator
MGDAERARLILRIALFLAARQSPVSLHALSEHVGRTESELEIPLRKMVESKVVIEVKWPKSGFRLGSLARNRSLGSLIEKCLHNGNALSVEPCSFEILVRDLPLRDLVAFWPEDDHAQEPEYYI